MNIPIGGISFFKIKRGSVTTPLYGTKTNLIMLNLNPSVTDNIKSTTFAVFLIRCKDTKYK